MRVRGNVDWGECAKVVFAEASKVPIYGDWDLPLRHEVNHIDIAISGEAVVKVPLAYGTYYYLDGDQWKEYTVTSDTSLDQKVEDVRIEPEDMKHATISAYDYTGAPLDDAFVVTGYSSNEHTDYSEVQVRIAGRFKVSTMEPISQPANWGNVDHYGSADNTNSGNANYYVNSQAIMTDRKNKKVTYVISAPKNVNFDMKDEAHGQLYEKQADGSYKALSLNLDIEMGASFDYFATGEHGEHGNECPPLQETYQMDENNGPKIVNNHDYHVLWQQGGIPPHGGSGMDFVLGGNAEVSNSIVALEITKMIVDESGKLIHPAQKIVNTMKIYENKSGSLTVDKATANSVADLNVEGFNNGNADYSGYIS